jgi:hypothetical protein
LCQTHSRLWIAFKAVLKLRHQWWN